LREWTLKKTESAESKMTSGGRVSSWAVAKKVVEMDTSRLGSSGDSGLFG
jgi:hypothetical protein